MAEDMSQKKNYVQKLVYGINNLNKLTPIPHLRNSLYEGSVFVELLYTFPIETLNNDVIPLINRTKPSGSLFVHISVSLDHVEQYEEKDEINSIEEQIDIAPSNFIGISNTMAIKLTRIRVALSLLEQINLQLSGIYPQIQSNFDKHESILNLLCLFVPNFAFDDLKQKLIDGETFVFPIKTKFKNLTALLNELAAGQAKRCRQSSKSASQKGTMEIGKAITAEQIEQILANPQFFLLPRFSYSCMYSGSTRENGSVWEKKLRGVKKSETINVSALGAQLLAAFRLQKRINSVRNFGSMGNQSVFLMFMSSICGKDEDWNLFGHHQNATAKEQRREKDCDDVLNAFKNANRINGRFFDKLLECKMCSDFKQISEQWNRIYEEPFLADNLTVDRKRRNAWKSKMSVWRQKTSALGIADQLGWKFILFKWLYKFTIRFIP